MGIWSFLYTGKIKAFLTHVGAWSPKPEQAATAKFYENPDNVDTFVDEFKAKLEESLNVLHSGVQDLKAKGFS